MQDQGPAWTDLSPELQTQVQLIFRRLVLDARPRSRCGLILVVSAYDLERFAIWGAMTLGTPDWRRLRQRTKHALDFSFDHYGHLVAESDGELRLIGQGLHSYDDKPAGPHRLLTLDRWSLRSRDPAITWDSALTLFGTDAQPNAVREWGTLLLNRAGHSSNPTSLDPYRFLAAVADLLRDRMAAEPALTEALTAPTPVSGTADAAGHPASGAEQAASVFRRLLA
jgi:hypothetical protein